MFSNTLKSHFDHFFYLAKQKFSYHYFNSASEETTKIIYIDKLVERGNIKNDLRDLVQKLSSEDPAKIINLAYPQIYSSDELKKFVFNDLRQQSHLYFPLVFDLTDNNHWDKKHHNPVLHAVRELDIDKYYLLEFFFDTYNEMDTKNIVSFLLNRNKDSYEKNKLALRNQNLTQNDYSKLRLNFSVHPQDHTQYESTSENYQKAFTNVRGSTIILGVKNQLSTLQRRLSRSHYNTPIGKKSKQLNSPQILSVLTENVFRAKWVRKSPVVILVVYLLLSLVFTYTLRNFQISLITISFTLLSFAFFILGSAQLAIQNIDVSLTVVLFFNFICYLTLIFYKLTNEAKKQLEFTSDMRLESELSNMQNFFIYDLTNNLKEKNTLIKTKLQKISQQDDWSKQLEMLNLGIISCSDFDDYLSGIQQFSNIDRYSFDPSKSKNIRVYELIENIVQMFDMQIKSKNLSISLTIDDNIQIHTHPTIIKLILQNLISNAVKYSNDDSTIEISASKKFNKLEIKVRDGGNGIPEEEQNNIWLRFYRIKNDDAFQTKGTGLGLYLSLYFARKIGAQLILEESSNLGSVFKVVL